MRKTARTSLLGALIGLAMSACAADASVVLYTNGSALGTVNAWPISGGSAAADSFILSSASTLTGVDFTAWNVSGETTTSVDWAILNAEPGIGTVLFSGTASVSSAYSFTNGSSYDVNTDSFVLPGIPLLAGPYWLELSNAVATNANATLWDINGGPSGAWSSQAGDVTSCPAGIPAPETGHCSMAFDIVGEAGITNVPEPPSFGLLASALMLLGLASLARLRSSRA